MKKIFRGRKLYSMFLSIMLGMTTILAIAQEVLQAPKQTVATTAKSAHAIVIPMWAWV
ncbi:MAG: hypothetical protein ABI416_10995 [Ginsengibacter sp.]